MKSRELERLTRRVAKARRRIIALRSERLEKYGPVSEYQVQINCCTRIAALSPGGDAYTKNGGG
jgi:hypothetical protein